MTLRLPMNDLKPISTFDPLKIRLLDEYNLLENIYATLFEYAPDAKLVSGLVSEMKWENGKVRLKIRKDVRTKDGISITADDVYFSLKRILVLSHNTHGRLADILCPGKKLENIDSDCPGIVIANEELILTPKTQSTFLLQMLASADFSILTRSSVDQKTLKIIDYSNTSGAYFVAHDLRDGILKLRANRNHWRYNPLMPQSVEIHRIDPQQVDRALQMFKSGELNYLPKWWGYNSKRIKIAEEVGPEGSVNKTWPFSVRIVRFSEKGLLLPTEKKVKLVRLIRDAFKSDAAKAGRELSDVYQYFQPFGDGGLDENQLTEVEEMHNTQLDVSIEQLQGIKIGINEGAVESVRAIVRDFLPGIEVIPYAQFLQQTLKNSKYKEVPDAFLELMDTSGNEDISGITVSDSGKTG